MIGCARWYLRCRDDKLILMPCVSSLLGVKRTWLCALHTSAFDPKRTSQLLA